MAIVIRNDREYREAQRRIKEHAHRLVEEKRTLEGMGLDDGEVRYGLNPLHSYHNSLLEEVNAYERLKAGKLPTLSSLDGLGRFLVEARIAAGITQRELARRLEDHETHVSRDENNDYRGITVARAERILAALGLGLRGRSVRLAPGRESKKHPAVVHRPRATHETRRAPRGNRTLLRG
jgi:hypothetical protein